jgi:uncharacterized protein YjbJ (UPF0337 family)
LFQVGLVSSCFCRGSQIASLEGRWFEHVVFVDGTPTSSRTEGEFIMDNDLDQAKGRIKQAAGDLTDNKDLKHDGKVDEASGKSKEFLEDAKDKLEGAIDKVKGMFKKN